MNILNSNEVAKLLHSDVRTIQRNTKAGLYPTNVCGRHGRIYLFNEEELIKFVFPNNMKQQIA